MASYDVVAGAWWVLGMLLVALVATPTSSEALTMTGRSVQRNWRRIVAWLCRSFAAGLVSFYSGIPL